MKNESLAESRRLKKSDLEIGKTVYLVENGDVLEADIVNINSFNIELSSRESVAPIFRTMGAMGIKDGPGNPINNGLRATFSSMDHAQSFLNSPEYMVSLTSYQAHMRQLDEDEREYNRFLPDNMF